MRYIFQQVKLLELKKVPQIQHYSDFTFSLLWIDFSHDKLSLYSPYKSNEIECFQGHYNSMNKEILIFYSCAINNKLEYAAIGRCHFLEIWVLKKTYIIKSQSIINYNENK